MPEEEREELRCYPGGLRTRSYTREVNGGEGGIRTPGTLRYNGFQDRRIRPLCHLSVLEPSATVGLANLSEIIEPFSCKQRLADIWILLKSGIITP